MELKKILFHHLPKCYGHTIRNIHDQIEEQLINDPDIALKIPRFFHLPLSHLIRVVHQPQQRPIQSTTPLTPQQIQSRRNALFQAEKLDTLNSPWFLFTFVRHPYDRIVSVWNFFQEQTKFNPIMMDQQSNQQNVLPIEDPRRMTFSKKVAADFLKYKYKDLNGFLEDREYFNMFFYSYDYLWFNSLSSFCGGDWSQYNAIYKCEDFENEIVRYLKEINIYHKVDIKIKSTNMSKHDFKVEYLTQKSKETIYEIYKEDFEALGYDK